MQQAYFVTGTDTGIGKTRSSIVLMHYFRQLGNSVVGMKPVASGCDRQQGILVNDDALLLQRYSSVSVDYATLNPYAFAPAVAPHLAAMQAAVEIDPDHIASAYVKLTAIADVVIVEGAGGWMVPMGKHILLADIVKRLDLPVIMVVGMRLGCLNHALLSFNAISLSGLECAGWIASCIDVDMPLLDENISTLKSLVDAPLLGVLPFQKQPDYVALAKHIAVK